MKNKLKNMMQTDNKYKIISCPDKCGECCRYLLYPMPQKPSIDDLFLLKSRRIKIVKYKDNDKQFLYIPSQCMYLDEYNHCSIYNMRPDKCKNHQCEKDKIIKGKY